MNKELIAILGPRGLVGEALIKNLLQRGVAQEQIIALSTDKVADHDFIEVGDKTLWLKSHEDFAWDTCKWLLSATDDENARKIIPQAVAAGVTVIDNSSAFRLDPEVPLVIPEVNADILGSWEGPGVVASPNCTTIQSLIALEPIRELYGLQRVDAVSFQSVSGMGRGALEELAEQTSAILNGQKVKAEIFPDQIAFNVLPAIGAITSDGYCIEEGKIRFESQKIYGNASLGITATTVRVPVFFGHGVALHVTTEMDIDLEVVASQFEDCARVKFHKDLDMLTPFGYAVDSDLVHVGRLRSGGDSRHLCLWIVADNILRGAALNSLDILELLQLKQRIASSSRSNAN